MSMTFSPMGRPGCPHKKKKKKKKEIDQINWNLTQIRDEWTECTSLEETLQ